MNCYRATQCKRDNATKLKLVALKGGACSSCGYSERACSLDFHHVDGKGAITKSLNIGSRTSQKDYVSLVEEVNKCEILCANCHCEHHSKESKIKMSEKINLEAKASAKLEEEIQEQLEAAKAQKCCGGKCQSQPKVDDLINKEKNA